MTDKESLISNLALAHIHIDDAGVCHYENDGSKVSEPIYVACKKFKQKAKYNCVVFYDLWNELLKSFDDNAYSAFEGSSITQSMFVNSVKQCYRFIRRYPIEGKPIFNKILSLDSKYLSEGFMLQFIDKSICLEWVYQLICNNVAVQSILEKLVATDKEASGSMGHIDLKMDERVYVESDYPVENNEDSNRLHPMYTRKFRQFDIQHGFNVYDLEDKVYRLFADPYEYNRRDERQPNRTLSRGN